ncbi:hypothetical protein CLAFUW4_08354 [Fulvia fulva]|uniref:Uncharacterized protein n=1 Tax=Passalora fulva TaxID=5499 RepID=A0A9Q8LDN1_PASFU|nr:uncharacterized protein CLAFUR5_08460 [Fulvia fulva]KAK4629490.1 hypothetical protein CLAFUR4_08359 [Fulvia fulva]KAK4630354.1 hypothetical protein CLAFUR0_08354 [Fulvia fulva]UJO15309.1 hypothetical protein CLAFUR5_08460 [Fulvia fulva]WPV12689.1 hypothetical protein CLAFUW4_08354 [Fulvia fulva]WPV27995.1 hypothetical protein CLAFUW7_08354 [Fulvia fulva]
MYISKLAALFAASLAVSSAAFRAAAEPPRMGVAIEICGSSPADPKACAVTAANINKLLVALEGTEAFLTSLRFAGDAWNVDIFAVQCRAYGNKEGTIPVGVPFNETYDLNLGTKPVGVYAILCYVIDYY